MRTSKKNWIIILLLVILGFVSYYAYRTQEYARGYYAALTRLAHQPTTAPTPAVIYPINPKPTKNLIDSFGQRDYDQLIANVHALMPTADWILTLGGAYAIEFVDSSPDSVFSADAGATYTYVGLCKAWGSDYCAHKDPTKEYIFMHSFMLKYQPYILASILTHELRHVYQRKSNTDSDCFHNETDAYEWQARFWDSLTPEQKQYTANDANNQGVINALDTMVELYKDNRIKSLVAEKAGCDIN